MAYKKISDLTAVTTPATTDLVEIEQSGVSYKATVAQITGAPNGGQPPAPKPRSATDSDIGQWTYKNPGNGVGISLPSGGSWAYFTFSFVTSTKVIKYELTGNVLAGGTALRTGESDVSHSMICWRIS